MAKISYLLAATVGVAACAREHGVDERDPSARSSVAESVPGPGDEPGVPPVQVTTTTALPVDAGAASLAVDAAGGAGPACPPPPAPGRGADVEVTVRAGRGPKGRPLPVPITRRLYGMNIADSASSDYMPAAGPAFHAYLSALQPGVLRWPAGHRSQEYVWQRGGEGQSGSFLLTPEHVDAFIRLARSVSAEPLVAVNVKRGTVAAATDLLRYLNVEKGYRVKYLQIGNEPDLGDSMTTGPEAYADQLVRLVDALHEIDPAVRIIGPELRTGAHVSGLHGTTDWMTPILARAAGRIDGISWHHYPLDSGQTSPRSSAVMSFEHLFQETAPDSRPAGMSFVDEIMPALDRLRAAHAPDASVWVTELAEDRGPAGGAGISDTLGGALWVGDVLGRYGEHGPGAVLRWLFKGSPVHRYGLLDENDAPRPAYGAYWLYARHFGDRFVDVATSSIADVAAHAAERPDGGLSLVLVNKRTEPRRVRVNLEAFAPCSGEELTLTGAGLDATSFTINGQAMTIAAARRGIPLARVSASGLVDVELPPASMRLVIYQRSPRE
jgi:hypothetical protein